MSFHRCIIGLILSACASAAFATTGASVHLSGDGVALDAQASSSTATFDVGSFDISLAPGETLHEYFNYTVNVTDDGAPAARTWEFCTPLFDTDCGPPPTGFEQAAASIWIGRDPRLIGDNDYMIDDSVVYQTFQSVTGTPGLYTGMLDYTATNASTFMYQSTTVTVLATVFVDASAVPEPSALQQIVLALGLASLLWLGARRRSRAAVGRR